jgi:L-threonylcarbamoyladenylate synthase
MSSVIADAVRCLRAGGVVALPTETVYGLGADALNPQAVARIFEVKQRPFFDPLIVHVPDLEAARGLVTHVPEAAEELARRFWPGPLTLVLEKRPIVPDLVTAGLPTYRRRSCCVMAVCRSKNWRQSWGGLNCRPRRTMPVRCRRLGC